MNLAFRAAPLLFLCCVFAACQPLADADEPSEGPVARKRVKLPGLVIDIRHRCVDVAGVVCLKEGPLELVACTAGSKEHESLVAVVARPMHLHTALLLLGATNGHPAMRRRVIDNGDEPRWINVPPRGDPIDVFLVYKSQEGRSVERPIGDFVVRSQQRVDEVDGETRVAPKRVMGIQKKRTPFPPTFLFVGSQLLNQGKGPRRYLADESGNVISIATFGDEVLSLPFRETQANDALMWRANSKTLPDVGTEVTLRLRLKADKLRENKTESTTNRPE